ncbi:AMP-binding protein [Streptomyces sp. NBC_00158]|uniref:AMP-binding protein n=1 Tax=Streptomyces sp. NBC_00158 TaxID=2903627 RepID=UPI003247478D
MTQPPQSSQPDRPDRQDGGTVLHRFGEWARRTPRAPALITGDETVPYAVLDAESDRLARHLTDGGLPAHGLVALALPRQRELVTALLAVLKAGGTYTVLDVADPRVGRRQLAALAPDLLIARPIDEARLDGGEGLRTLDPDRAPGPGPGADAEPGPPSTRTAGAGGAAVLFTGAPDPRPVPVGHATLLAAHEGWAEAARLAPGDRHLFTAGPDTTPFAAGWTRALCSGGALVLPEGAAWLPGQARRAVRKAEVSVLHTDPAGAAELLLAQEPPASDIAPFRRGPDAELRSLRLLAVSGDRLYLDEHSAFQDRLRPGARVLNVYALTEAAGTGAWFELPQLPRPLDGPERISLLGTPFPGCGVRVLDGQLTVDPPGGGEAIATGDLGVLRPDGLLEFAGRAADRIEAEDGTRIDPYPLESEIRAHTSVGTALVTRVSVAGGGHRLVAYLSPPHGLPAEVLPDTARLREHLKGRVPADAVPRAVVRMRATPRTRAGREDRTQVPQPPLLLAPVGGGRGGGKYGGVRTAGTAGSQEVVPLAFALGCGAPLLGLLARMFTGVIWPGSTDLTGVPNPWALLFWILYLCESLAFGAGVVFLLNGRRPMLAQGRGRGITTAAHLAIAYLLIAWWPQDNLYRLAAKQDWPRQAALVYAFNVPLMVAALVVAVYATRKPVSPFDFDD